MKDIRLHSGLPLFWTVMLLVCSVVSIGNAGVIDEVSVEGLVRSSDIIVLGRCLSAHSDWNSERTEICTYTVELMRSRY